MNGSADQAEGISTRIRGFLGRSDGQGLSAFLEPLPRSDALREVLLLSPAERNGVLSLISPELAAALIAEAPNELAVDLVERMESGRAAEIIEGLDSDVQADVIGELDKADAEAILSEMDAEDAADVRRLAHYADETAGGLMVAEAFTFGESETVGAVLRRLASEEEDFERYRGQHPYVVDDAGKPIGVVSLRNLLTSARGTPLTKIMAAPVTVHASMELDALQGLFDEYPFLGMPVVESDGRLVGVVSRAAVNLAALERAEAQNLRRHGVVGDELRSMPLVLRARRRLAWLSTNIVLNIIAASVISATRKPWRP